MTSPPSPPLISRPFPSAARWQRSSFSGSSGNNCVELARRGDGLLLLRESDVPMSAVVTSPRRFAALLDGVKDGRFDRLLRRRGRPRRCPSAPPRATRR